VVLGLIDNGVVSWPADARTGPVQPDGDDAATDAVPTDDGAAVTSRPPAQEPPAAAMQSTADQSAAATLSVGTCVDAQSMRIDCVASYAAQVFASAEPCDRGALDQFVGLTARDVLRPDLALRWHGEVGCVMSVDGASLSGSTEDAFADPRSHVAAQLRHCLDVDLDPASCVDPHHGEVVGHHDGADQCTTVALGYLGRDGGRFPAGDLVIMIRGDQCVVTVKGDNALSATLRDIGRRSLPIEARS
jgi:hypothetical protein